MHQKDGNRRKFLNCCFNKIVEIERFALRAAILDECQNYLGGGGRFGWEKIGDCDQSKKFFVAKKNPRPGKNTYSFGWGPFN